MELHATDERNAYDDRPDPVDSLNQVTIESDNTSWNMPTVPSEANTPATQSQIQRQETTPARPPRYTRSCCCCCGLQPSLPTFVPVFLTVWYTMTLIITPVFLTLFGGAGICGGPSDGSGDGVSGNSNAVKTFLWIMTAHSGIDLPRTPIKMLIRQGLLVSPLRWGSPTNTPTMTGSSLTESEPQLRSNINAAVAAGSNYQQQSSQQQRQQQQENPPRPVFPRRNRNLIQSWRQFRSTLRENTFRLVRWIDRFMDPLWTLLWVFAVSWLAVGTAWLNYSQGCIETNSTVFILAALEISVMWLLLSIWTCLWWVGLIRWSHHRLIRMPQDRHVAAHAQRVDVDLDPRFYRGGGYRGDTQRRGVSDEEWKKLKVFPYKGNMKFVGKNASTMKKRGKSAGSFKDFLVARRGQVENGEGAMRDSRTTMSNVPMSTTVEMSMNANASLTRNINESSAQIDPSQMYASGLADRPINLNRQQSSSMTLTAHQREGGENDSSLTESDVQASQNFEIQPPIVPPTASLILSASPARTLEIQRPHDNINIPIRDDGNYEHHVPTARPPTSLSRLTSTSRQSQYPNINQDQVLPSTDLSTCSICLTDYAENEMIVELPCRHWFHHSCLKPWLKGIRQGGEGKRTCPLCVSEL
ncbi:hypothetical protein HDU76_013745 [Blyttiomyces sp. JEL0837]|nr:hypothetical protein HDU76_013745 [Blyttiomyces sp. JEL0837]